MASKEFIGLRSDCGTIEYNARFLLDDERAESLVFGKWYKYSELQPTTFLRTSGRNNDAKHKWRRIGIND